MHRGLLMARVVNLEILIGHHVEERQYMISRECEDVFHSFEFEGFTD
jgi:hypothetical protein